MWWRQSQLEEKMDAASHDHYVFMQGYYAGRQEGVSWAAWLYNGAVRPASREPDKASPYRRLLKWYERKWKRGER